MADSKFKNRVKAEAGINLPASTASRALTVGSGGDITSSSVTDTELGYVSGVTSSIQTQLGNKIDSSEKGANNGVATLDAGGKVPAAQLPNTVMEFKGTYDPNSDTPALSNGTGNAGDVYVANAGSHDFGAGSITFAAGDWVVYNGSIYEKSINSNAVVSVNGQQGVVSLDTDDVSEGATNLYFTNGRAQSAITGGASSIVTSDLAFDKALVSSGIGKVAVSATTATELGYVSGVTSAIQTQLNGKEPTITTLPISKGGTNSSTALNDNRIMVSNAGAIVESAALTDGQILIGSTGAAPAVANITAGTGISITNGAGTISISAAGSSVGDLSETTFGANNNQATPDDVGGFLFSNATVRSFRAQVSVSVDATSPLNEAFDILGIQKGASWDISVNSVGDDSGFVFSITAGGQIQYTSSTYAGFVSASVRFRATVTGI